MKVKHHRKNEAEMYTHKTHIKTHQKDTFLPCVRTRVNLLLTKVTKVTIIIKKKKLEGGFMKSSYQKLAKQRDEAIFYIKTALKSRQIHMKGNDPDLQNLKNALTLDELLDNLTKLYEIK